MTTFDTVPCYICSDEIDLDDSVWADSQGNVNNPLYAYCVADLPSQLDDYSREEDAGYEMGLGLE